jgi:prolyl-tRNA synthetase
VLALKLSENFTKTSKSVPADEVARNAQLLIQAGFIHKEMAGVYGLLPMGLEVLENIKRIVREEMNDLGGQEFIMTSLQRQELWEKTDRWDEKKVDVWFKTKLQNGKELGLAWSHEEPITDMMRNHISSYRDLPANVYQFQTKLRNELRAKSGIMRCREFVMKDLYSYSLDEQQHQKFYDRAKKSYMKVFERVGLGGSTYLTFASGGAFTQFSHEFQTVTEAGEDTIYIDEGKRIAINEEVYTDEVIDQLGVNKDKLKKTKAAEVGNIFSFGATKSEQLDLNYTDENGETKPVILGSYGIGITRLMGVIVEHFADEAGIVWPENVAPARVYIARLGEDKAVIKAADKLFEELKQRGLSVIYDDRDVRPGQKFADAELMGIPYRVVISQKSLDKNKLEIKYRTSDKTELIGAEELISKLAGFKTK